MTKVVTKTTQKTTKKVVKTRDILGVSLSKKLPNEVKATIEVIKANKGKVNVPFETLYSQYVTEMSKISKSKSNLKTRFRRILYRNLEGILLKNSIQSAKFNLKANIKGITIKTKNPIEYKANGDAVTLTVDENFYSFKVLKKISTNDSLAISKELLSKVAELKA
tara:strand:- start:829 stop:1323 length:495 start_codon:yes stop_codon:yes gene_type:complete